MALGHSRYYGTKLCDQDTRMLGPNKGAFTICKTNLR